jgi:hypothetical protein
MFEAGVVDPRYLGRFDKYIILSSTDKIKNVINTIW